MTLSMEAFLVSTGLVAAAEIGDKTQLLALLLAARYRRPVPIILGIFCATLANHALAAWAGGLVAGWIGPEILRWVLGVSFLAMAAWCLVPDKADNLPSGVASAGAFVATLVAFFLVEIGDKTQIATVALAARFDSILLVTAGTTLGMMLANVPVVIFGDAIAKRLPLRAIRIAAALIFVVLGVLVLAGVGV
jgi:Ca2+/H+ antiporter, TMEM165/GDT1 family